MPPAVTELKTYGQSVPLSDDLTDENELWKPEQLGEYGTKMFREGNYDKAAKAWVDMADITMPEQWEARKFAFPQERKIGKYIYLPVEIAARELKSKAKIAGELARKGYQVLLASAYAIKDMFNSLPPGVMLFKTMNKLDALNMGLSREAGHFTAVLNEEFFGLINEKWIYQAEIAPQAKTECDIVFAQNPAQQELYNSMGIDSIVTGNPRFDPSAPREKHRLGNEILIPTMAGTINNLIPIHEYVAKSYGILGGNYLTAQRLIAEQIKHECKWWPEQMKAIEEIATYYPDRTIRLRPHPSENPEIYSGFAKRFNNVIIDDRTSFTERLADAACVVFISGCTTGLEARLADIPACRVGIGGHGISAQLGHPYHVERIFEVNEGEDLSAYFAPVTLTQALDEFSMKHQIPMKFDLLKAARYQPKVNPRPFFENKFPDFTEDQISAMCGVKATSVNWRTWVVRA